MINRSISVPGEQLFLPGWSIRKPSGEYGRIGYFERRIRGIKLNHKIPWLINIIYSVGATVRWFLRISNRSIDVGESSGSLITLRITRSDFSSRRGKVFEGTGLISIGSPIIINQLRNIWSRRSFKWYFRDDIIRGLLNRQRDSILSQNFEVPEDGTKNSGRHDEVEQRRLKFRGFTWPTSTQPFTRREHKVSYLLLVAVMRCLHLYVIILLSKFRGSCFAFALGVL